MSLCFVALLFVAPFAVAPPVVAPLFVAALFLASFFLATPVAALARRGDAIQRPRDEVGAKPTQTGASFTAIVDVEGGGSKPHPQGGGVVYRGLATTVGRRR